MRTRHLCGRCCLPVRAKLSAPSMIIISGFTLIPRYPSCLRFEDAITDGHARLGYRSHAIGLPDWPFTNLELLQLAGRTPAYFMSRDGQLVEAHRILDYLCRQFPVVTKNSWLYRLTRRVKTLRSFPGTKCYLDNQFDSARNCLKYYDNISSLCQFSCNMRAKSIKLIRWGSW